MGIAVKLIGSLFVLCKLQNLFSFFVNDFLVPIEENKKYNNGKKIATSPQNLTFQSYTAFIAGTNYLF